MNADLDRELAAAQARWSTASSATLGQYGISFAALLRAGFPGCARVSVTGRTYAPDPRGQGALILPIYEPAAPWICLDYGIENWTLVDLIAFRPALPGRWFYRLGYYGLVLGDGAVSRATTLHDTPLQWLQAGCQGSLFLDVAEARAAA